MIPTYSIIIPHKNIPDLLRRCLNSLPKRDDVQVIIVDDNSDSDKVDFEHFPGLHLSNTEVYFDKTGKGAGHARNIGLKHAKGKWLLFADSDDLYTDDINDILIEYKDAEEDIIYFNHKSVMSNDLSEESHRTRHLDLYYRNDITKEEINYIRCKHVTPWGKMIKRELIEKTNARFDETRYSNDVMFSIIVGCNAEKIRVIDKVIYLLTEREGSLTAENHSVAEMKDRALVQFRSTAYMKEHGYKIEDLPIGLFMQYLMEADYKEFLNCFKSYKETNLSTWYLFKDIINRYPKRRWIDVSIKFALATIKA